MIENINLFSLPLFDEKNQPYACNVWVIYKNKAYKSIKPNNNRHPHDSEYWYEVGGVQGLLDHLINDHKAIDLALPYYPECNNGCVAMFDKGQCVIDRIKILNPDGTPAKDDCGKEIYELQIFTSLVDCNTDSPLLGSNKEPPTWDGGYSTCGYLNRPVAYTQDGNTEENRLYPDAPQNLKCVLGCDSPDNETIALAEKGTEGTHSQTIGNKLRVIHDNKSIVTTPQKGLEVAVIGKDKAGNPVDVRNNPCFVTCDTVGNGLTWDETAKKWIVNLAKGLTFTTTGAIEALLDTLAGLKFNGNKIAVAIKNGLNFNSSGEIEVKAANNSIIVDASGIKANLSDGLTLTSNGIKAKAGNNSIIVDSDGIKVGQIGVDRNGNPVNAGACLVTCATDLHVTSIDDTGVNTVITLSDGTTVSGPEIDKDDYVVSYVKSVNAAGESILTITMKSGATHQVTLPADVAVQDSYVTGLAITSAGLVTATRNNGLPALTAQIQFPEPTAMTFPMIGLRGSYTGSPTDDPPITTSNTKLHFNRFVNATGGFSDALNQTDIIIPKTGWYRFDHRCTTQYTSATPPPKCGTAVKRNGVKLDTLGINFGSNFFPDVGPGDQQEAEKSMYHYCTAGDVITVETGEMSPGAEVGGETFLIKWESF